MPNSASSILLRAIVDSAPVRLFWKDRDSRYLGCNAHFATDAGVDGPQALIGRSDFELAWKECAAEYREADRAVMESGIPRNGYEEVVVTADGRRMDVRTWKVPLRDEDGAVIGVLGIYADDTERRQYERMLQEHNREFRALFERSPDAIWLLDGDNRFMLANHAAAALLGHEGTDDLVGLSPADISPEFQPDGEDSAGKAARMIALARERGVHRFEWWHLRRDGRRIPFEVTLSSFDLGGQPRLICIWHDLSERIEAGEALRRSEEKYRGIFDESVVAIYVLDLEGRVLDTNQAGVDLLGYTREELLRITFADVDAEPVSTETARRPILRGGKLTNFEHRLRHKDGRLITVLNNSRPLTRSDGTVVGMQSTLTDITEWRQAQQEQQRLREQLAATQRLESVGRLAGGVAHDFNNMLSVILGRASLAMEMLGPDDPALRHLREVMDAGERSADLTRQLLAFARRQIATPVEIDLNDKITGLVTMLGRLIGEDIAVRFTPGEGLWPVRMDPSQVDQVVANLCLNARDAIAGTGRIEIETGNTRIPSPDPDVTGGGSQAMVQLTVRDNGCGMTPEVLENIFEPFFTTKEVGKGSGLGLATVYGIVKQNGGHVEVSSEPGYGSTFRVYLPAAACAAAQAGPDDPGPAQAHGTETVLLVEDEPAVREITQLMLETFGYTVLPAQDAPSALALAASQPGRIDLLVTDVIMPRMSGWELAAHLRERLPGLRTLFVSGYPADVIAHRGVLVDGLHFLQKPFSASALSEKVREVLDSPAPA